MASSGLHNMVKWMDTVGQIRYRLESTEAKVMLVWIWWTVCLRSDWLVCGLPLLTSGMLCCVRLLPQIAPEETSFDKRLRFMLGIYNDVKILAGRGIDLYHIIYTLIPDSPMLILLTGSFVTPFWCYLLYLVPLHIIMLMAGTFACLETVEAYRLLRKRLLNEYNRPFIESIPKPNVAIANITSIQKNMYSGVQLAPPYKVHTAPIILTENQRYYGKYGWKPPMEPQGPPAWSNVKNCSTLPKTLFELLPPVIRDLRPEEGGCKGMRVCFYWEWSDPDWSCVFPP